MKPWCAALAMLVSFAADAGQQARLDMSRSARVAAPGDFPDFVPRAVSDGFGLPPRDPVLREARLVVGAQADLQFDPDETDPKAVLKPHASGFPTIDRTHRGDPGVGLRPTFGARLRRPGSWSAVTGIAIVFADEAMGCRHANALDGVDDLRKAGRDGREAPKRACAA